MGGLFIKHVLKTTVVFQHFATFSQSIQQVYDYADLGFSHEMKICHSARSFVSLVHKSHFIHFSDLLAIGVACLCSPQWKVRMCYVVRDPRRAARTETTQ